MTATEEEIRKNGNKPVNPNTGQPQQQNVALQRLLRALTGEERRWQPKGTPSRSHLLGRAFRDLVFPWLLNEYDYHMQERRKKEEAREKDFPNKLREEIYSWGERPAELSGIANPAVRKTFESEKNLLGTVPASTSTKADFYDNKGYIQEGVIRGDDSFQVNPPPLTTDDYLQMFGTIEQQMRNNPTERINPHNPSLDIRNKMLPPPPSSENTVNGLLTPPSDLERLRIPPSDEDLAKRNNVMEAIAQNMPEGEDGLSWLAQLLKRG